MAIFDKPKCQNCGADYAPYPLWSKDKNGKKVLLWKNLFKMDTMSLAFLIFIIVMTIAYKSDTSKCNDVIKEPCTFCEKSKCCSYIGLKALEQGDRDWQFSITMPETESEKGEKN